MRASPFTLASAKGAEEARRFRRGRQSRVNNLMAEKKNWIEIDTINTPARTPSSAYKKGDKFSEHLRPQWKSIHTHKKKPKHYALCLCRDSSGFFSCVAVGFRFNCPSDIHLLFALWI